jgi:hypothetical protein
MRNWVRTAGLVVALVLGCCGLIVIKAVYPLWWLLGFILFLVGGVVSDRISDRRTRRRLGAEGWQSVPADQPWPWLPLIEPPGKATVRVALTRTVDRLPVTVGEIAWDGNALAGAVKGYGGQGVFVVVELPAPTGSMALRRSGRTIGTSHRLDFPAMRAAFEAGEIPPWTAAGDRLFTFTATGDRLRVAAAQEAVRRTLLVVRLLDLGPD